MHALLAACWGRGPWPGNQKEEEEGLRQEERGHCCAGDSRQPHADCWGPLSRAAGRAATLIINPWEMMIGSSVPQSLAALPEQERHGGGRLPPWAQQRLPEVVSSKFHRTASFFSSLGESAGADLLLKVPRLLRDTW